MKTLISGSILLVVALFVSSCTDTNEAAEPTISALKTTETETVETTKDTATEVSEADLRDPVKQYKRYVKLLRGSWNQKVPEIDETQFRELATDEVANQFLEIFAKAREEGYYFDDPSGYEEIITSDPVSSDLFTKDEDGLRVFIEGSTVNFKTCAVDDSITKDSKTDSTLNSPDEDLDTFESSVSMIFLDGKWKVSGENNLNKTKGVAQCEFQK